MIIFYVSGLAFFFGATLSLAMFMMIRKKTEPESEQTKTESEQDAQQPSKAAAETTSA